MKVNKPDKLLIGLQTLFGGLAGGFAMASNDPFLGITVICSAWMVLAKP